MRAVTFAALALLVSGLPGAAETSREPLHFRVFPERAKQTILGLGFEIQSDSIGSGNHGLPGERIAVPHDLTPAERKRLAEEMLKGFRYCRLAGGLYWRGLDPEGKFLRPRWPEQLEELKMLLDMAGIEGVSFEYWSPAPFWKANRSFMQMAEEGGHLRNRLRPFAPGFAEDPDYRGDRERFFRDFSGAVVADIRTLRQAGLRVSMFGLQNEPHVNHAIYPSCEYPDPASYLEAFRTVASAVRRDDPEIMIVADTYQSFPRLIAPGMRDPEVAKLVDAYVVHIVASASETPRKVHAEITAKLPPRPWFQNEYEYLTGGATPDRCLNTVNHIMNSFQLAENPAWFWLHALKPIRNAEASGYALGFWQSRIDPATDISSEDLRRWHHGPLLTEVPVRLKSLEVVNPKRGDPARPGVGYSFLVNQPVTVYAVMQDLGGLEIGPEWESAGMEVAWQGRKDAVFKRSFPAGQVEIPANPSKGPDGFGAPHLAFVEGSRPTGLSIEIGMNMPILVRSDAIALERKIASVPPGHWICNPYNWHAVGSFAKRMPWNSVAVEVSERVYDANARILAFKRPDGKLSVVLSNRNATGDRKFRVETGLPDGVKWKGFRFTPEHAGEGTLGVPIAGSGGGILEPVLTPQSWEFWEQQ
jgi:hypothetical protein